MYQPQRMADIDFVGLFRRREQAQEPAVPLQVVAPPENITPQPNPQ